jgi:hypothetical protein
MRLKVCGSACSWYRVSWVGPSQLTENRNSVKRTVGKRAAGILMEKIMLCVILTNQDNFCFT